MSYTLYRPGDKLGDHYTITDVYSASGMGTLYLAYAENSSDPTIQYAIKEEFIQATDSEDLDDLIKDAHHQASILMQLDHPAIPKMLDCFIMDDRLYLITEFVEGKDLDHIINEIEEHLPVKTVYQWAIDLCNVLDYLHTHGPEPIVFRDLKPSNIILTPEGQIQLVDYGIAGTFSEEKLYPPMGTDGYAAPEQYNGHVTPSVDIYALGATLHHLLTRRDPRLEPPFTFDKRRIGIINPAVSWELEDIVMQAVAIDPMDRFTSAAQMRHALLHIMI